MHFRERGQSIQVIRTVYDADKKKGKNEIVGKIPLLNPEINAELEAVLTEEERKEVHAWIDGQATLGRLKRELAVRTLPEQLTLAETWFNGNKGDEARVLAAALFRAWVKLRVLLKRDGLIE